MSDVVAVAAVAAAEKVMPCSDLMNVGIVWAALGRASQRMQIGCIVCVVQGLLEE